MKPTEVLTTVKDSMTARRVYAEPIERDGVVVIPAARVSGGGGGGSGTETDGREGSGGGFAVSAKPVGAYVIEAGRVSWRPAVDVNRLITVLGVVAVAALVTRRR
ncbi:spore germination protein GerW family protein [Mycolicibacterium austroafricanum]|uniref:spore germination protein GerW family protein n=1 Tax=Mycolicibacterium austroafricanum TaxID=39687 RepID=UPI000CF96835|nr:spore germination protein GerW family protein [Mycolicibacterium austroafricanum]PQP46211.1 sporulation protein [Mycolicibacterium austroafricanum]